MMVIGTYATHASRYDDQPPVAGAAVREVREDYDVVRRDPPRWPDCKVRMLPIVLPLTVELSCSRSRRLQRPIWIVGGLDSCHRRLNKVHISLCELEERWQ